MRIVICDQHTVFAESLAYLMTMRGDEVVAVTGSLVEAADAVRRSQPDVCTTDVLFSNAVNLAGLASLGRVAGRTAIVLLSGSLNAIVRQSAQAIGVGAIVDKCQPIIDIIAILDRVYAGEIVAAARPVPADVRVIVRNANDAQRLAYFLTPRERQVLSALVRGDDTRYVSRSLGISVTTARCHIQSLLTKMGAHSRLEVATTAVREGMINPTTGEWLASFLTPVRS
jgi:two-component system nitrate/nitrite response regulator NarL